MTKDIRMILLAILTVGSFFIPFNTAETQPDSCKCGQIPRKRIVGGEEAGENDFPFMAVLHLMARDNSTVRCGGSLITRHHVLTAAHCFQLHPKSNPTTSIMVILGAHNLKVLNRSDIYWGRRVIKHENFNLPYNDIALLLIWEPVRLWHNVFPICLPRLGETFEKLVDQEVTAIGWGVVKYNGKHSEILQRVNLQVIPFDQCLLRWKDITPSPVKGQHLCTHAENKDSCEGDSGGPLFYADEKRRAYLQVALVSFGSECATSVPAANTDISTHIPWIIENIRKSMPNVTACDGKVALR